MTSLQPRPPYTDAELRQLYPPHLQLQFVQVLMRHGERTPVNARFENTGLPAFWPYCAATRNLTSALLHPDSDSWTAPEWRRRLETFGPDDGPVAAAGPRGELDAICDMGMLTDLGRTTTYHLGRRLRSLYVDRLGFLPPTIADADSFYLRSTPVPRALESLQQAFTGLYPASARAPSFPNPTILIRSPPDETLFPNEAHCRRFAALARAFAQRAADRWNDSPEMAYLNKKLGKWMPPGSPAVAVDGRPRLSGIMDTINATRAHDRPETTLPSDFYDPKAIDIIHRIAVEEWFAGYRESNEYRTLGIGGLLADIVGRMVGSAEGSAADGAHELPTQRSPLKMGLSGCHDTTLGAVLTSLGTSAAADWPPFTSHIALELFRSADLPAPASASASPAAAAPETSPASRESSGWFFNFFNWSSSPQPAPGTPPPGIGRKPTESLTPPEREKLDGYYVRLRYNDEPVTIPGCKPAGNHLDGDESFCTLEAFKSIVDKFTPTNWKQQCRSNKTAPVFPEKEEPAGSY
ncbi:hypothetical protein ACRALDRAFT_2111423 [Sodiomyces alcalophilus JCM 7366]|uniref:uncharacterized protein n=1 Tax=Sodiomyces alcalophilus JCM 7366 TaxID=591952 RepID=UPI0039B43B23